jgi:predicted membrane protein
MEKIIKVGLAALLLLCLAEMPYGYYQLVRWAALVGFSLLAFHAHEKNKEQEMIIYIALAILFQPLFKIALGRLIWNFMDAIAGIYLLHSIKKQEK